MLNSGRTGPLPRHTVALNVFRPALRDEPVVDLGSTRRRSVVDLGSPWGRVWVDFGAACVSTAWLLLMLLLLEAPLRHGIAVMPRNAVAFACTSRIKPFVKRNSVLLLLLGVPPRHGVGVMPGRSRLRMQLWNLRQADFSVMDRLM